jgi:hypothetical protein
MAEGKLDHQVKIGPITVDTSLNIGTLFTLAGALITIILGAASLQTQITELDKYGGAALREEKLERKIADAEILKITQDRGLVIERMLTNLEHQKERILQLEKK